MSWPKASVSAQHNVEVGIGGVHSGITNICSETTQTVPQRNMPSIICVKSTAAMKPASTRAQGIIDSSCK